MRKLIQKLLLTVLAFVSMGTYAGAQLSGVYTIGGTSPDFATLSAAAAALNNVGVSGPVDFIIRDGSYSGTSWIASLNAISGVSATNRVTFRSQGGTKASVTLSESSSNNYIFQFNNTKYVTVKDMTLTKTSSSYGRVFDFGTSTASSYINIVNCAINGVTSTSSSNTMALVYAYYHTGTDNSFANCTFSEGGAFVYWYGNGTSSTSNNLKFNNNTFTSTGGYYGVYSYYTDGMVFNGNTLTRSASGVYYPIYCYANNNDYQFTNNTITASSTTTMYFYQYYVNYYSANTNANVLISDNTINLTNTSGTTYAYTNYGYNCIKKNNTYNMTSTTGGLYCYGLYYFYNSECYNNDFNIQSSSSGYAGFYDMYYGFNSKSHDNTIDISVGSYVYLYTMMYGSNSEMYKNKFNIDLTTSYCYPYTGYDCGGGSYHDNELNITNTTGQIYGVYSGYSAGSIYNNKFRFVSTSGQVYGFYPNYMSSGKIYNNTLYTKSSGTTYCLYPYGCTGGEFLNNTIYDDGTGSSSYLIYDYDYTSGSFTVKNNIFSRKTASSNMVYVYDASYSKSDNNLFYTPGNIKFYSDYNPSITATDLQTWRAATDGRDRNSLFYQPPFVNASSGDLHINPSSTGAWAVNGRAEHDTTIKTDIDAVVRPYLVTDGVPDLGAYEVTPTSTPPNATATPASPVANSTQYFLFAQDTVATIDWGATVPAGYTMRQYSGLQAAPMPAGVGRMFFYVAGTPTSYGDEFIPNVYYKDYWIGDVPGEANAVIARSSNNGAWEGYNYSNANTNTGRNILSTAKKLDSLGSFTGVQNGRIGIRCVENPKGIVISKITAFDADVDWAPVFNPIGYQVVVKKAMQAPTDAEWASASFPTTNSLSLSGLDEDTKYYVYIRSVCGLKDTSGYAMDSFSTLITCHTPIIKVSDINNNRAIVSWSAVKSVVSYEYVLTTSPAAPGFGTDINKTSMLSPFLDEGKIYYAHVKAHCNSIYAESGWATEVFNTWKTGVNDIDGNGLSVAVYPNPVQHELSLNLGSEISGTGIVMILDVAGKVMSSQVITKQQAVINTSALPAGTYVLQYKDDAHREQVKFNKQ